MMTEVVKGGIGQFAPFDKLPAFGGTGVAFRVNSWLTHFAAGKSVYFLSKRYKSLMWSMREKTSPLSPLL